MPIDFAQTRRDADSALTVVRQVRQVFEGPYRRERSEMAVEDLAPTGRLLDSLQRAEQELQLASRLAAQLASQAADRDAKSQREEPVSWRTGQGRR